MNEDQMLNLLRTRYPNGRLTFEGVLKLYKFYKTDSNAVSDSISRPTIYEILVDIAEEDGKLKKDEHAKGLEIEVEMWDALYQALVLAETHAHFMRSPEAIDQFKELRKRIDIYVGDESN